MTGREYASWGHQTRAFLAAMVDATARSIGSLAGALVSLLSVVLVLLTFPLSAPAIIWYRVRSARSAVNLSTRAPTQSRSARRRTARRVAKALSRGM